MRTHIRTHFNKKTTDLNEDNYISCVIAEENNGELHPITSTIAQPEIHSCDKCSYSSAYKNNVVRPRISFSSFPLHRSPVSLFFFQIVL